MTKKAAPSTVIAASSSEPVMVKPVEAAPKQKNPVTKPTVTIKKAGIVSTIRSTTQSNNDNDNSSIGSSAGKKRPMNTKEIVTPTKPVQSTKPIPTAKPVPVVSKKVLPAQTKLAGRDNAKNKIGKSSIASSSGDSVSATSKKASASPKAKGGINAAAVSPKKSSMEPTSPVPKQQSIDTTSRTEIVSAVVSDGKMDESEEKQLDIPVDEVLGKETSNSEMYENEEFEEPAKTPKNNSEHVTFNEETKGITALNKAKKDLSVDPQIQSNETIPLTGKSDGGYEDDKFDSPIGTPFKGVKETEMENTPLSTKSNNDYDDEDFEDPTKTPSKAMEVFDEKIENLGQKPKPPLDPRMSIKAKSESVSQEKKNEAEESLDAQSTTDDVSLLGLDPVDHIVGSDAQSHPEKSNTSAKPNTHGSKDDSDNNTVGLVLDPQGDNNSVGLSIGDSVTYADVLTSISHHPEGATKATDPKVPDAVPEEDDGTYSTFKVNDGGNSMAGSISKSQDKSVKEKGIALGGNLDESADYTMSKDENEIQGIPNPQPSNDVEQSESLYGVDFEQDSVVVGNSNSVDNDKKKASVETAGSLSKPSAVSYNDDFEQNSVVLQ